MVALIVASSPTSTMKEVIIAPSTSLVIRRIQELRAGHYYTSERFHKHKHTHTHIRTAQWLTRQVNNVDWAPQFKVQLPLWSENMNSKSCYFRLWSNVQCRDLCSSIIHTHADTWSEPLTYATWTPLN